MISFVSESTKDDQVVESYYRCFGLKSMVSRSRAVFLFCSVVFLIFSSCLFYVSGYSILYSAIFLPPIFVFYFSRLWFVWRYSVIGYKLAFFDVNKKVKVDGRVVNISKVPLCSNFGDSSCVSIDIDEICKIVKTSRDVTIFFNGQAETFKLLDSNVDQVDKFLSLILETNAGVDVVNCKPKLNIFF